jgi:hypothetical protein
MIPLLSDRSLAVLTASATGAGTLLSALFACRRGSGGVIPEVATAYFSTFSPGFRCSRPVFGEITGTAAMLTLIVHTTSFLLGFRFARYGAVFERGTS